LERALAVLGGVLWDIAGNAPASGPNTDATGSVDTQGAAATARPSKPASQDHESVARE
jgi:hypothetical protein